MGAPTYPIPTGPVEAARAMIGRQTQPRQGIVVSEALIQLHCGAIEDGNPRYWQDGESPPGMIYTWIQDLPWVPGRPRTRVLALQVPLPGTAVANVSQSIDYHDTVRVGDRLSVVETLEAVSEEKQTPLGLGCFVTTRADIARVDGSPVATVSNTVFRYRTP